MALEDEISAAVEAAVTRALGDVADRVVEAAAPAHLQLLTTDELAAQLGVTAVTVRTWRSQRGMGPPWVKIGRLIRYRATVVEQWLNGQEVRRG